MHFSTQGFRQPSFSLGKASSTKEQTEMVAKQTTSSTTTVNIADLESHMETLGVSCWDFAYPTGKCALPAVQNCCPVSDAKSTTRKAARAEHKSKHQSAANTETVMSGLQADQADDRQYSMSSTKSRSQHHHHHHHKSSSKHHHRSRSNNNNNSSTLEVRTYLLSCPTVASIIYPQTYTTISTLLQTPSTQLVLLVPQSNIVCPKVCELMRLPRTAGSGIRVLPVPPEIEMRTTTTTCDDNGDVAECESISNIADALAVDEVVTKILKNTPTRHFDGYIAFEDDRAAWTFLDRVGKGVKKGASRKGC
ncbi:uncharacterized protein Z520_03050 [Fonsecaea multimorphosa CBS 102226]|uniref:Uncharacterized protein n=1 Tax=Fonsecaea multimorphosa CBS 102226 TaxID=1442371 RepID=A0A0D2K6M1_9EURO|nr:uncharacterized protein Z520_03050 [Fonsecaea multimorphosa CBS 102226]KIY01498.1 hypothetical protein Z520_03050 [Fonsecaea multimorphosa CBS 102226]OAL28260.1 hypothetical protein AYO22_02966 [Fonsecaea multimorphosa]